MSTNEASQPEPPAIPLVADRLSDFSDRLSPMLVKELRQGLRAKTFVIVFLSLQGLLTLVLLTSIAAASSPQNAGGAISSLIFMFYGVAVLVVQPIRGIGTLHREVHGRTIELMVLTRLSAWKIVLGKWVSIVSQSALLFAAIIPYLILRYWFGDMNLFGEVSLMFLIFIISAVLTALVVGISCVPSVILRGLVPLLAGAWSLWAIPVFCFDREFEELVSVASMQSPQTFWGVTLFVLSSIYLGWTALGVGSSMIAPAAENHTTPRRLITLGLFALLAFVSHWASATPESWCAILCVVLIPALIISLTEPFVLLPPICRPFVERGGLGRLVGRFLYPGWPSGVLFCTLTLGVATLAAWLGGAKEMDAKSASIFISIIGSLLMPAVIVSFFDRKITQRLTLYLLFLASSYIVTLMLVFLVSTLPHTSRGFLWFICWLPQSEMLMTGYTSKFDPASVLTTAIAVTGGYLALLITIAMFRMREISAVESESIPQAPKP